MEFSPQNPVVKLCLSAMHGEERGDLKEALSLFMEAWNSASNDLEKFMASFFVARQHETASEKLPWLEKTLEFAKRIQDGSAKSAFAVIYHEIAACYEKLDDKVRAELNRELAKDFSHEPDDQGPFFHGTKADLKTGEYLNTGGKSNYQDGLVMNHIYFTALLNGAGLAARLARGEGMERVYLVEPTGSFENDPNVTNKKFPGNLTRSYRSDKPLRVVGEIKNWATVSEEELQKWREKLDKNRGEIIN